MAIGPRGKAAMDLNLVVIDDTPLITTLLTSKEEGDENVLPIFSGA